MMDVLDWAMLWWSQAVVDRRRPVPLDDGRCRWQYSRSLIDSGDAACRPDHLTEKFSGDVRAWGYREQRRRLIDCCIGSTDVGLGGTGSEVHQPTMQWRLIRHIDVGPALVFTDDVTWLVMRRHRRFYSSSSSSSSSTPPPPAAGLMVVAVMVRP